jgi:hypothetical protein
MPFGEFVEKTIDKGKSRSLLKGEDATNQEEIYQPA